MGDTMSDDVRRPDFLTLPGRPAKPYRTHFFAQEDYNSLCYYLPLMKQTTCS
jgi:hypothetical protein